MQPKLFCCSVVMSRQNDIVLYNSYRHVDQSCKYFLPRLNVTRLANVTLSEFQRHIWYRPIEAYYKMRMA